MGHVHGRAFTDTPSAACQQRYANGVSLSSDEDRTAFAACFARDTKELGWAGVAFDMPKYDANLASFAESTDETSAMWTAATPNAGTFDQNQSPTCRTMSVAVAQTDGTSSASRCR